MVKKHIGWGRQPPFVLYNNQQDEAEYKNSHIKDAFGMSYNRKQYRHGEPSISKKRR